MTTKSIQPIIDFIPIFNFLPEDEVYRLWNLFSKEKYAAEHTPIFEFEIKEFKTWLKSKNWKI